jgi:pimeloyl-ACP methyl ester carboxylesterase
MVTRVCIGTEYELFSPSPLNRFNHLFSFPNYFSFEQDIKLDDLDTNHFVLVHGGGFGAWCWYKTIALLEEGGFKVTAIDLAGSGIHSFDTNGVTSLSQYVKPLTDFLDKLADGEKVLSWFFITYLFCLLCATLYVMAELEKFTVQITVRT